MPSVQQSAGSSAQQPAGSSNTGMNDFMSMGCKLMGLIMEQAKALDALQGRMPKPDAMGKFSSSTSLASHSSECSLLTPKALPATSELAHGDPPLLALPAPPAHETNHEKGDAEKASHDNDQSQGKSLEEYEKEAMQRVSQKKAKELDAVVKRPASKKAFAKVKASPKSKVQKQEKMKHTTPAFDKGIFGCVGCRGNTGMFRVLVTIFWWKAVQLQARVQQMVPEEAAGSKKEVKTFPFNPVTLTKGLGCNMAKSHTMPRLCMVGTCKG